MFADYLKPYVLTLLLTGMRPAELHKLEWKHVRLADGFISIPPSEAGKVFTKTGKGREIDINSTLNDILTGWKEQTKEIGLVFSKADGSPLGSPRKAWTNLKKRAGIEASFRRYDLRHSFATWLTQSGVLIQDVSTMMGHASVTTTEIYAHAKPRSEETRKAVETLTDG